MCNIAHNLLILSTKVLNIIPLLHTEHFTCLH